LGNPPAEESSNKAMSLRSHEEKWFEGKWFEGKEFDKKFGVGYGRFTIPYLLFA
jgi:hypothetical protein